MMPLGALSVAAFNHFDSKASVYRALGMGADLPKRSQRPMSNGAPGENAVGDDSAVVSVLFFRALMMMRNTAAR
jgi:hypothetical protein